MSGFRAQTVVEQLAGYLRRELEAGKTGAVMPGVLKLEAELGVNRKTVEAALRLLEKEGLLKPQGPGRRRLVRLPKKLASPALRVGILPFDAADRGFSYMVDLQHRLLEAGHTVCFSTTAMSDLNFNLKRVVRLVAGAGADAWVVVGGSGEVLEWFAAGKTPAFALFGRRRGLPIAGAGPDKVLAIEAATKRLIGLGHQRIILLTRRIRRLPEPGMVERAFLAGLSAHGIVPSPYHLPDWEEDIEGFYVRLEALFQVTPPTALIVDEAPFFVAVFQFCANRGLRVPQDVSLVCTDYDPGFDWCRPSVAHIRWDSGPVVRRIVSWAANVSRGKEDLRQTLTPAEFVAGGTIGPAKDE